MAKKKRNPFLDRVGYGCLRALLFVMAYTPEWIVYPALDGLGRLYMRMSKRRLGISVRNLTQAFGDSKSPDEIRRMAIRACGANLMVVGDLARIPRMLRSGKHDARFDMSQLDDERARMRADSGPIICTPHLGSWEVAAIFFGRECRGAHIIARPLANPLVQDWIFRSRARLGLHVHPRRGGVRKLVAALREGKAIGLLPDQNQRIRGLFVEFFGRLASCDRSAAKLSQMSGAPIQSIAACRLGRRYRFVLHMAEPFRCQPGEEGLVEGTRRLQATVEEMIRRAPEQYLWSHDRYRTRPPEERAGERAEERG